MIRLHRAHWRLWLDSVTSTIWISAMTLLILLGSVPAGAAAEQTTVVGVVERMSGSSDGYALRRSNTKLPLRICDQVQTGDRIVVEREGGEVWVRLTTGEKRVISLSQSDQPLEIRGTSATFGSNLLASFTEPFTRRHDFLESNVAVRGLRLRASTGQQLALPLVPERGAMIATGRQREFTFAWLGGMPPFRVSIVRATGNGPAVLEANDVFGRDLPSRELMLPPGIYTLRILDAAGARVERPLEAVPASTVPQAPSEPALTVLPPEWRATAQAGWLAQRDDGRWSLEAFLQVTPLATSFEPARILANLLAQPTIAQ